MTVMSGKNGVQVRIGKGRWTSRKEFHKDAAVSFCFYLLMYSVMHKCYFAGWPSHIANRIPKAHNMYPHARMLDLCK